jgi:biopolymer transport protein ExbD
MPESSGWQVRRAKGRRIYTDLSRAQVERALRSGKLTADDLALPPGADRWMTVPVALVHSGEEAPGQAAPAETVAVEWAPMQQEGRLIRPEVETEDPAEMDMTPMIDVTTLLLIFFLVGGTFMLQAAIELPKAKSGSPEMPAEIKPVGILIDLDAKQPLGGTIAFEDKDSEFIELDNLVQSFKDKLTEGAPDIKYRNEAVIRAHREVPFGLVRQTMAKLTEAGAARIAVAVEESPDKKPSGEPGKEESQ